jgi:hypothetical protein
LIPRARLGSEAVDVDRGQFVGCRLKNRPVVTHLDELAPVGGRAAGGRYWWQFEWFTQLGEDLPDRPRLGDECDTLIPWPGTQFQRWNCVLLAPRRDLIGGLPRMRRSGRTEVSDLKVSLNALKPFSEAVCVVGGLPSDPGWKAGRGHWVTLGGFPRAWGGRERMGPGGRFEDSSNRYLFLTHKR